MSCFGKVIWGKPKPVELPKQTSDAGIRHDSIMTVMTKKSMSKEDRDFVFNPTVVMKPHGGLINVMLRIRKMTDSELHSPDRQTRSYVLESQ